MPALPPIGGRRVPAAAWLTAALVIIAAALYFALRPSRDDARPLASIDGKSIAVLPFENLSAEADAALFADGMHEEMLTALGRVSAFKVIARASVLPYRDPAQRDLRRIAADLEIGSVVEGSVRRMGSRVRIAVKLIDAQSRRQLWGDTFERDSADVFSIQAAVAQEVAAKLRATLTPGEQASLAERPSSNARAYALYVEAKSLLTLSSSKRELWDQKVATFEQATQLDPQFAGAFAQLSSTHSDMYFYAAVDGTPARIELARRALAEAQRLAPDHGETSLAAGKFAYACEADYPKALRYFELALRWNPNDASVRGAMGNVLRRLGRHVEGAAEIEKAFALDPAGNAGRYSQSLLMLRRYREHLAVKERELRLAGDEESRQRLRALAMWPRFEITGDRDRFFRELAEDVAVASPSRRLGAEVRFAVSRGDWEGTLALLSEERLAQRTPNVALDYFIIRARMAHVLGRRDIVLSACERARALRELAPRERFREMLQAQLDVDIAALLGREAEFQHAADALHRLSQDDRFIEPSNLFRIATGHLILGDKATALQHLETFMTGPSPQTIGPRSIRLDPFWGKLAGDARFEEILRKAKPL